ncbi:MAG: multicopper oxidase family protein, partial [Nannocystaceae bacterium]|nr:multicopper oxidase family protein [Nannocystaceae bacterium]
PTEVRIGAGPPLRVWAYNGQVPGPTLRIWLGDTLKVHFVNRLPDETTIHWHGVRVPNNMDGVPHVTQPPVRPGESFLYEFTPKDAGTYWFHPHVRGSEQVERGLHGVLIVEDAEPAPFSQDVMWVVDDWRLDANQQIDGRFNTRHDLAHDGRWGKLRTVNGNHAETLRVRPGERIRLRMLNCANGRMIAPDFGPLRPKIIAVDGKYLRQPIPMTRFEMAPGNRLDLDITFEHEVSEAVPIIDTYYPSRPHQLATIAIDGPAHPAPVFASPAAAHVPVWSEGLAIPLHHDYRMNARAGGKHGIEWTFDNAPYTGHANHSVSMTLTRHKFHRIRFTNESSRLHPIHMHGTFFRLLARNGQPVDEPFFRDTVLVHGRETVDLGLVPTDVGKWMVHCHILEHAEAGMMTLVEVLDPTTS